MPGMRDIADVWRNLKEVDLRPIQRQALEPVRIAIVGRAGANRDALVSRLRTDPYRPSQFTATPLAVSEPESTGDLSGADLVVLLLDGAGSDMAGDQGRVARRASTETAMITLLDSDPDAASADTLRTAPLWSGGVLLVGPAADVTFLEEAFVPAVLDALPDHDLALARQLPLFRATVARRLIEEVSLSNATYAISTGLAGLIPILNIPLNVTDMLVLTKAQAFMVYRIGLALGLSTRWQDYVREFGGVIGGGFVWREVARTLVGLIPVLGIVPKVAIAYAGTFVVGNVVWHWYLTGRHLPREQLRALYRQASAQGRRVAKGMLDRLPRRRRRAERVDPVAAQIPRYCYVCGYRLQPDDQVCPSCRTPVRPSDAEPDLAAAPTRRGCWPFRRRVR